MGMNKVVTSQLTCSKCNNELTEINKFEYDWKSKVGYFKAKQSFTVLQQLINTEILDKLNLLTITCTTCSISFTKNDLNIKILPMIGFVYYNNGQAYYANCSVCSRGNGLGNGGNTPKNREYFFDIIKRKYIDKQTPCSTCGVTYAGIKWWNGSVFVDYSGE